VLIERVLQGVFVATEMRFLPLLVNVKLMTLAVIGFLFTLVKKGTNMYTKLAELKNNKTTKKSNDIKRDKRVTHCQSHAVKQLQLQGSGTIIKKDDVLQHGSSVKEFRQGTELKDNHVPDGPAWYTAMCDYKKQSDLGGFSFNILAGMRKMKNDGGNIYVHTNVAKQDLELITFTNHKDAISKVKKDFKLGMNKSDKKKKVDIDMPSKNNKEMADLVKSRSTNSVAGYRYKKDKVLKTPEVVLYDPDNSVEGNHIETITIGKWQEISETKKQRVITDEKGNRFNHVKAPGSVGRLIKV